MLIVQKTRRKPVLGRLGTSARKPAERFRLTHTISVLAMNSDRASIAA